MSPLCLWQAPHTAPIPIPTEDEFRFVQKFSRIRSQVASIKKAYMEEGVDERPREPLLVPHHRRLQLPAAHPGSPTSPGGPRAAVPQVVGDGAAARREPLRPRRRDDHAASPREPPLTRAVRERGRGGREGGRGGRRRGEHGPGPRKRASELGLGFGGSERVWRWRRRRRRGERRFVSRGDGGMVVVDGWGEWVG